MLIETVRSQKCARSSMVESASYTRVVGGSSPSGHTKTELNGFFKARRWDARSASH